MNYLKRQKEFDRLKVKIVLGLNRFHNLKGGEGEKRKKEKKEQSKVTIKLDI